MHILFFLDMRFRACTRHETLLENVSCNKFYTKWSDFVKKHFIDMSQHLSLNQKNLKNHVFVVFFSDTHLLFFLEIAFQTCEPHETPVENGSF